MKTSNKKQSEIDARTPDAFLTLSDKLLKWIEDNALWLGALATVVFVSGLGYLAFDQWKNWSERKATSRIYQAEAALNQKREELGKVENNRLQELVKEMANKKDKKMPAMEPTKVDFEANYAALASAYEKAILADKNSKAGVIAAINLAGFYLANNKVELATTLLEQVGGSNNGPVAALLQVQRATLAMEKSDYERAIDQFEQVLQNKEVDFLHSVALLKIGVCYERMKELDRAREAYIRVSTEFGETESARTAKGYLRLLEIQSTPKS